TKRWGFTNWDTFYVEKPFGRIFIEYGEPLFFDRYMNQKECAEQLIAVMDKLEYNNLQHTSNEAE
ncbi:MAG: hypothetical protein VYB62_06295, partial [Candidatus Neomarinimicrobiota bacterium]|nr:hypothetical protein [Candidatus Neomarinimicrobiota bacterium]